LLLVREDGLLVTAPATVVRRFFVDPVFFRRPLDKAAVPAAMFCRYCVSAVRFLLSPLTPPVAVDKTFAVDVFLRLWEVCLDEGGRIVKL